MATNADIVTSTYQAIAAGFSPTAADLATYTALMNGGWTQAQVAAAIEISPFVQNVVNPVIREYQAAFGRVPDAGGLKYWVSQIAPNGPSGATNTSVLANLNAIFVNSTEFSATYGTFAATDKVTTANSALVIALYNNVLGRNPDAAGLTYWTTAGVTVSQLLQAFAQSQEFVNISAASVTAYENAEVAGNAPTSGSLLAISPPPGVSANLTAAVDTIVGTSFADTYTAQIGAGGATDAATTLNALDSINGGAGTDTLVLNDQKGSTDWLVGTKISNVEVINLNEAGTATMDVSGITGVTNFNVSGGASDTLTAGSTTAVNVSSFTTAVTVVGGSTQTLSGSGAVTASKATGAVTVTDTAQGTSAIAIDGGTSVSLTTTVKDATSGTIKIGATTAPSGAITVVDNIATTAGNSATSGNITVKGGTSVSVTEVAAPTVNPTDGGANGTITQGSVTVDALGTATKVTVAQSAALAAANATAVGVTAVTETATITFGALKSGDVLTIAGYSITAAADMTAAQVAQDFASLATNVLTNYTSSAVANTNQVTFTSTTAGNVADLTPALTNTSGNSVAPTATYVQGVSKVTAAGNDKVVTGTVAISDTGTTNVLASVSLTNYGATSTIQSDALTSLSLTNSSPLTNGAATGALTVTNTKSTTLDLTVAGGSQGFGTVDLGGVYTSLKAHVTSDSTISSLVAGGVTALTVDGTGVLKLSASTLGSLATVTATGAAGINATLNGGTVTDINVSGSSAANTVTIDATKATYEGGSGVDTVTVVAAPTKAISGGAGTADVLVVNVAAGTFSNPSANSNISGFEILGLGSAATGSYDATGFTGLTEGAVTGAVTYTNVAAGTGLTITASPTQATTYTLKDATGTSDVLNLTLKAAAAITGGTVTASGIETVNITATNSSPIAVAGATADSLTLVDTAVKAITVTGNTTLTLTTTGDTALTSVDASGMTGGLTYTTAGTVAETVKGGATANTLTAGTGNTADTLIGGAAKDTLTANAGLDTLTGGGNSDTFVVATAGANVNVYSTITDGSAGDLVQLSNVGTETFVSGKVTLANTAVFQDYANAAVGTTSHADHTANAAVSWFQYNGDTYVVEVLHDTTTTNQNTFVDGTDIMVKLTGLHDLTDSFLGSATPTLVLHN